MSIFAECPTCRKKQSVKNKVCGCGEGLDQAKKSERVRYWVDYYLPSGKRRRESVGFSIKDAQAKAGKIKGQKKENRPFDILPESKMTFLDLKDWYLNLEKVKSLASYSVIQVYLRKFNSQFGEMIVSRIKPADLENLIEKRKKEGCANVTIDHEIGMARTMVLKAFDNDIVGGNTIRAFKKIKKLNKGNANARSRIISPAEFSCMLKDAPLHIRQILITAYHTGMRKGEILNLTWDKVNLKKRFIYLEASDTKDREKRSIPISDELHAVLQDMPKAIRDKHVFLYKGKPIIDIREGLRTACRAAGVSYGRFEKNGFVFHDLRHTFNTNMRKAGVPESVIMKITGHSTRAMFDRYNTVDEGDLREAIERMKAVV
ncbi:MAG: tyrosine-type recombinase/integrase [Proteobacteria bacterium]|nr:tyrosine-type recombinase/integrase [Pseudomonadota bacterium]MBU1398932.1 tyrosine-type recombinase/integrase [Pseudomonadota bacterium]MBU1570763.1 tyrosine-type recombinase/integrase [Pseudomonadota bacterium]